MRLTNKERYAKLKRDPIKYSAHVAGNLRWYHELRKKDPKKFYALQQQKREYGKSHPEENRARARQWIAKNPAKKMHHSLKANAEIRKIPFKLTVKWIEKQFKKQKNRCAVTGLEFQPIYKRNPFQPSVDRINNAKGYTPANCHIVCLIYNYAKLVFTHEDVMTLAKNLCAK